MAEIQRVIREEEPQRPSVRISTSGDARIAAHRNENVSGLSRLVRGDLDWIVMKALEKERARRYETASELAADIERHLRHEPVVAGPPGTLYRFRKLLTRNRAAVGAGGLVFLALLGGTVGTTLGMVEAGRQRDDAVGAKREAEDSLAFLIETLALTDPEVALNPKASIQVLLASAASRLAVAFDDNPHAEARLRATIGLAYESLGQNELAESQLRRAAELMDGLPVAEVDQAMRYRTLWALTAVAFRLERSDAFGVAMRSRDVALGHIGASHPEVAEALRAFSSSVDEIARVSDETRMDEALKLFMEAVRVSEAALPVGDALWPIVADIYMAASYDLWYTPHEGRSVKLLEEVLRIQRRELPANHPDTAETSGQLVGVLTRLGRPEEAEARQREAVDLLRDTYPEGNFHVALAESMLGGNLTAQGRYAEAEELLVPSHEIIATTIVDPANFYVLDSLSRLIELYAGWGRDAEAERYRGEILQGAITARTLLPGPMALLVFGPGQDALRKPYGELSQLCGATVYSGRPGSRSPADLADPLERLLAAADEVLQLDEQRSILLGRTLVGWTNAVAGDEAWDLQARMARESLRRLDARREELPLDIAEAEVVLARAALESGDRRTALDHARRAVVASAALPLRDSWWNTVPRVRIARHLMEFGWFPEAEELLLAAWNALSEQLGPEHSEVRAARVVLVELYRAWDRPEDAARFEVQTDRR